MKALIGLILLSFSSLVLGAAFAPGKGKGVVILGASHYQASYEYDDQSKKRRFLDSGKFEKTEISYFATYSFSDRLTLVGSGAIYNHLEFQNNSGSSSLSSAGDQFLALRWFFKKDSTGASAINLGVGFPLYSKNANPTPGNAQRDLELRYLRDYFQWNLIDFISWELALRLRDDAPSDQIRADITIGEGVGKWLVMGHASSIIGLRNSSGAGANSNPNAASDFDLLKVGPSVAYRYYKSDAFQFGILQDIWGRNTGKGTSVFVSWWKAYN